MTVNTVIELWKHLLFEPQLFLCAIVIKQWGSQVQYRIQICDKYKRRKKHKPLQLQRIGWFKNNLTQVWRFIFGNKYIKQKIYLLYLSKRLISFHKNLIGKTSSKTSFMLNLVKASILTTEQDFVVILTNLSAQWNVPSLPIVTSKMPPIWSLFMLQWHITTLFQLIF